MGIRGLWEAEAQLTAVWGPWRLRRWKCDTLIPIPYPWGGGQGWGLLEAGPSEMRAPASAGREVSNCSLSAQPQLRKLVFSLLEAAHAFLLCWPQSQQLMRWVSARQGAHNWAPGFRGVILSQPGGRAELGWEGRGEVDGNKASVKATAEMSGPLMTGWKW